MIQDSPQNRHYSDEEFLIQCSKKYSKVRNVYLLYWMGTEVVGKEHKHFHYNKSKILRLY